jgi:hypothetical protein
MAASVDGWFDEIHDTMRGFHESRGGVVFGPHPSRLMPLPHLGSGVSDVADPRLNQMLPYHFQPFPGTGMAQGKQVSPGSHLRCPAE